MRAIHVSIVFIINHTTLTNSFTFIMLHFLGTQYQIFRAIKVASVIFPDIIGSTINRVFVCFLFILSDHIGVKYDGESDVGCLQVSGRNKIK